MFHIQLGIKVCALPLCFALKCSIKYLKLYIIIDGGLEDMALCFYQIKILLNKEY